MIIDSSVVINIPQDTDFKTRRKAETENIKPVEDTGNSNKTELDFNKDRVEDEKASARKRERGDIYGNRGELQHAGANAVSSEIDIIV